MPLPTKQIDVSFVILTWNSAEYIKKCIDSYARAVSHEGLTVEFLVVDNGSSDGTLNEIENSVFPNLPVQCIGKLYKLEKNFGTTKSRNIALRKASGRWIVICDSDTEYFSGSWKQAIDYLAQNKSVGILAPCLIYPSGVVQNSVKKFPTIIDKLTKLGKIFFKLPVGKSDFYQDFPWGSVRAVDTAISACWIFTKKTLYNVGYLDEKIFYSPEDVDFCLRMWKSGKKILFYPQLKIVHYTQQVSHAKPFSRLSISHFFGLIYYFAKHKYFTKRPAYGQSPKNEN